MTEETGIESPCVRECCVDQVTGYCLGCFRTLKEISYWASYTHDEKRRVLALIETRRADDAGSRPPRSPPN